MTFTIYNIVTKIHNLSIKLRVLFIFQSLNYDTIENDLHWQEKETPKVKVSTGFIMFSVPSQNALVSDI